MHGLGSIWIATPLSSKTFTPYSLPVSPAHHERWDYPYVYSRDGRDSADDLDFDDDDLAYQDWPGERAEYARPITSRCERIETPDEEDRLCLSALAFIGGLKKLDEDEIAERCFEQPVIAGEALSVLLQERRHAATLTR